MCVTQMCGEALSKIPCCQNTNYSQRAMGKEVGCALLWHWSCSPIGARTQILCEAAVFKWCCGLYWCSILLALAIYLSLCLRHCDRSYFERCKGERMLKVWVGKLSFFFLLSFHHPPSDPDLSCCFPLIPCNTFFSKSLSLFCSWGPFVTETLFLIIFLTPDFIVRNIHRFLAVAFKDLHKKENSEIYILLATKLRHRGMVWFAKN